MKIQINEDWSMDCDTLNVILRHRVSKGGHTIARGKYRGQIAAEGFRITYYPTYRKALKALVDADVMEIDAIADIVARIDELQRHIDALPIIEKTGRGAKHGV